MDNVLAAMDGSRVDLNQYEHMKAIAINRSNYTQHVIIADEDVTMTTLSSLPHLEIRHHDDDDDVELNMFDVLMGVWIPGLISVFGIIGNLLSLWVLSRDPEGSSTTFTSLKALAVSDVVLLVFALLQQIVPMYCEIGARSDRFCLRTAGYLRVYTWPVVCIAQMASIWMTVLISAERFVAICAPLRVSRSAEKHKIRRLIAVIAAASVIFNLPRFFEFTPKVEFNPSFNLTQVVLGETAIRHDPTYRYLYNTALYCLVIYALPLLILTYLNGRLVRALKKARRNWRFLNTNQKREMKATKLPLVIVTVFFVCGTESLLGFVLDAVFLSSQRWLQVYTAVVNVLVIVNSAVNFLLMFFFGKKFRRMLGDALRCRRRTRVTRNGSKHNVSMSLSFKESSL